METPREILELVERFRKRDRHALSRLLSLTARGEHLDVVRRLVQEHPAQARKDGQHPERVAPVVAVTGSPGVGKSTLVGRLIEALRQEGRSVAVLACDPQSPLTGGALLGDRLRMPSRPDDEQVFIRSLATPGGRGAIPEHIDLMVGLLKGFGFEWVILETVGAGQGETAVHHVADVVVLLVQPEAGDDIQWEKAGLLEVADVIVVHKADLPGADRTEAQIRAMLNLPGLSGPREVPVLRVSSARQEGIQELLRVLEERVRQPRGLRVSAKSRLRALVQDRIQQAIESMGSRAEELAQQWQEGGLSDDQVLREVLAAAEKSLSAPFAARPDESAR
ncbi:MAG: ATP/GTP-binding protein [Gemmatales bacterium]|nr:ATP/GTP-binding protein [Gemmatales bacterium]MDW8386614.1 GTP-binding protein [Gemmatales bacterium]